jgi:outer membrane protein assembly factor BamA
MRFCAEHTLHYGAVIWCAFMAACATVPQGKYGVSSVEVEGVNRMDESALLACLATKERPRFGFSLGPYPAPECGTPPFDAGRLPVDLWIWPWTEWPIYEQSLLERDLERVERWYRARGYYGARVTKYQVNRDNSHREVNVDIAVSEGQPVVVTEINITGIEQLPLKVRRGIREAIKLQEGGRFDEALYEKSKVSAAKVLAEASFARASIAGKVSIDVEKMEAVVSFEVTAGPSCRIGNIIVEGNRNLPQASIVGAAGLNPGALYSDRKLAEAQDAIYTLGAFSSVEIVPQPRADSDIVDVVVRVIPARRLQVAFGAGIEAGTRQGLMSNESDNFSRWDVHLLARVEGHNFLGGMRRLRVEERPRLIFDRSFPMVSTDGPKPGNLLMMELKQPAVLEPRTSLTWAAEWDYGPDPYRGTFYRHDLDTSIGPSRYFFGRLLFLSASVHLNLFAPTSREGTDVCTGLKVQNYHATFVEYVAQLDRRNDIRRTTRGWFVSAAFQHAGYFLPSDWNYLRFIPDARGYVSLARYLVLAARARLGILAITSSDISNDDKDLHDFGPYRYRLRGGGPNSVRGFEPNWLGDVRKAGSSGSCLMTGGVRQWEASVELRVPVTVDFGTVLFIDAGDVTQENRFRFNYPQTTLGFGLRYHTLVGPLRFDMGFLPNGLQVFGTDRRPDPTIQKGRLFGLNGAWQLSIGEAF